MKRKNYKLKNLLLLTLANMLMITSIISQAPAKMSYQAVIRDNSDNLITEQEIGVQISILQGSEVGTAVFVETHTATTNKNGLVTLMIGDGTVQQGELENIDWQDGPYVIKTETDVDGGTNYTITSSSMLQSVPYAMHSTTAEILTGEITEIDPLFNASPAADIETTDIDNWNEAHGWGDHSTEGYLTDYVVTEEDVTQHEDALSITESQISDLQNYLTSDDYQDLHLDDGTGILTITHLTDPTEINLTPFLGENTDNQQLSIDGNELSIERGNTVTLPDETDPLFTASPASGIETEDIDNWDEAHGWGDHSTEGYLTEYDETDPLFTASPASGIETEDIDNWDEAHGWGDHSTEGYLTEYDETDPLFTASPASGIETEDIDNWDEAHGWGDHSTEGYLTEYDETDPLFTASPASGIETEDIDDWNMAYSWGDHSAQGYITDYVVTEGDVTQHEAAINITESQITDLQDYLLDITDEDIDDLNNVNIFDIEHGEILVYDESESEWINALLSDKETDPLFTAWDRSEGIEITESQITDLEDYYLASNPQNYITNLDETDPVFSASPAAGIEAAHISIWNLAYSWGDHSEEGYITDYVVTEGDVTQHEAAINITESQITDFGTYYLASNPAGYISNAEETDPLFSASAAAGIIAADIDNWNDAYDWGDHSAEGYLTGFTEADPTWSGAPNLVGSIGRMGDVGIGTDDPQAKLEVRDNDALIHGITVGRGSGDDDRNTVFGNQALADNTSGNNIVAIGLNALNRNIDGDMNTAIGASALALNETSNYNTAVGYAALYYNVSGTGNNTAVGNRALKFNLSGSNNTAVGYHALRNSLGFQNVAIGSYAMDEGTGNYATAVGYQSLERVSGAYNSAFGHRALQNTTSGEHNTAAGHRALADNTTGQGNTSVGYASGVNNNDMVNTTFVGKWAYAVDAAGISNSGSFGYNSRVNASNQLRFGNSSVNDIGGHAAWSNLSDERFKNNVRDDVAGLDFIMKLRPVTYNLDAHKLAGFLQEDRKIDEDGNVLYEKSQVDIKARDEKSAVTQTGFIAQQVEKAANEAGFDFSGIVKPENEKSHYSLRYSEFVVPMVKAMQEQQAIIEQQQQQINDLQRQVNEMRTNSQFESSN